MNNDNELKRLELTHANYKKTQELENTQKEFSWDLNKKMREFKNDERQKDSIFDMGLSTKTEIEERKRTAA